MPLRHQYDVANHSLETTGLASFLKKKVLLIIIEICKNTNRISNCSGTIYAVQYTKKSMLPKQCRISYVARVEINNKDTKDRYGHLAYILNTLDSSYIYCLAAVYHSNPTI